MSKLFESILVFCVAFQFVAYVLWAFNFFGGIIQYPFGDVSTVAGSPFSLDVYSVLLGVGGAAIIGVAALLLKVGTYAIYAMLLWGIGIMFKVVQTFFLVIPNTLAAMLPPEANPNPSLFAVNPIILAIGFLFTFAAWMMFWKFVVGDR